MRDSMSATSVHRIQFELSSHSDLVLAGLKHLREKQQLFDVVLIVEGQQLPAHRVVLASCSDYFRAMFTHALVESHQEYITLNGVTAVGMKGLVNFAYTSKLSIDLENVQHMLSAASHVQIIPVITACSDYLQSMLSLDNFADIATIADTYSLTGLKDHIYRFICKNFSRLSMKHEFYSLSAQQLEWVLKSNYLVDCSEQKLLEAVLDWIYHNGLSKMQIASQLLQHVHFEDILVQDFIEISNQKNFKEPLHGVLPWKDFIGNCLPMVPQQDVLTKSGLVNYRGFKEALLVVGGFSAKTGMTNDIMYCHKNCGTWKKLTKIPHVQQCNFGTAVLKNNLYVVGGCYNQQVDDEVIHPYGFKYNPGDNKWQTIAPMALERCRFNLGKIDGLLYAFGGDITPIEAVSMQTPLCEVYNLDTDSWTPVAPLPQARSQHAGVSYGHYYFISGGLHNETVLDSLLCYNSHLDTWHARSPMLSPRSDHVMFVYKNSIYVVGGSHENVITHQRELTSTIDRYIIEEDHWEVIGQLPEPRLYSSVTCFDNQIFIIGGWSHGNYMRKTCTISVYDLKKECWTEGSKLPVEIWEHASCSMYVPLSLENVI